jgi:uncharacterized protein (TIGR02099 family)
MSIPLRPRSPEHRLTLEGAVSWPGPASLTPTGTNLDLDSLSGALSFDQTGVRYSSIGAELWGEPLDARIHGSRDEQTGARSTHLRISGTTTAASLTRHILPQLSGRASGAVAWTLQLDVRNLGTQPPAKELDIALSSELRGLAVDLPAPVGKVASESRPFQLGWKIKAGEEAEMHGRYAGNDFILLFGKDPQGKRRLRRAGVRFGSRQARLPDSDGLHLSGRLSSLDLPAWTRATAARPGSDAGNPTLRSADLQIGRLLLGSSTLNEVHLELDHEPRAWAAVIKSSELTGRVSLPHRRRQSPILVRLDHLDLEPLLVPAETAAAQKRPSTRALSRSDPRRSHTLDLSVEHLHWGENGLGHLTLVADARDDGLLIRDIKLDDGALMQVSGQGHWTIAGGQQTSLIELKADGKDLGEFLRNLGYESLLDEAPAVIDLRLSWPGGPGAFSLPGLDGEATLEIGRGSLLEVEPGVGRMLGIFNLGALNRRLSLDFSDLFDRGYAFERIHGKLNIRDGKADIAEMVIEGPSAEISIKGKTDLVNRQFDQVVTVTPSLGTSVALATAVAGGPLVGAAVLIADKVSGGAFDKIGRYSYDVTGPWAAPNIKRRPFLNQGPGEQAFLPKQEGAGAAGESPDGTPGSQGTDQAPPAPQAPLAKPAPNLFLD